jgi:hypothetical protein
MEKFLLGWLVVCFVLSCFFETGSQIVAQADLKLEIFLTCPPKCQNYRHAPHMAQLRVPVLSKH